MSDIVNVNGESAEGFATEINGAARYFQENPLLPCDEKSTISANGRGKTAYYEAQMAVSLFGTCLEQEAANIRSLGASFEQYDEMLALLWESGTRYPVIKAME